MKKCFSVLMFLMLCVNAPAFTKPAPVSIKSAPADIVAQVTRYFDTLETLQADFIQGNPDGTRAQGTFIMRHPGKFRFEYAAPSRALVVCDGKTVVTYDYDMDNPAYLPFKSLPISMLFTRPLRLEETAHILKAWAENEHIFLVVALKEDPQAGRVLLDFTRAPFHLSGWTIEADGAQTDIQLHNVRANLPLQNEKTLFRFRRAVY